jgi:hypothetical protein
VGALRGLRVIALRLKTVPRSLVAPLVRMLTVTGVAVLKPAKKVTFFLGFFFRVFFGFF